MGKAIGFVVVLAGVLLFWATIMMACVWEHRLPSTFELLVGTNLSWFCYMIFKESD